MIDNRPKNDNTLGRFRSGSDSRINQTCYYPLEGNDRRYIKYRASPIEKGSNIFTIKEITGTTICGEKYKRLYVNENEDFNNDNCDDDISEV